MAITITVEVSDADAVCMANDLMDIDLWVQDMVKGKISKCRSRMIQEWQPRLFADPAVTSVPADPDAFIAAVTARSDYRNRVQRQAEEDAAQALATEKAIAERVRRAALAEA